jgi:hypothetical protein
MVPSGRYFVVSHPVLKVTVAALAFLLTFAPHLTSQAPPNPVPLPRMKIPATSRAPVIDGVLEPAEWDRAAACTGFVTAFENKLAKTQSTAWMTYDSRYLYVAFRNFRSPQLKFISARARRDDDDSIVYDPANEIWFTPPGVPQATYQTLFNVYPAVFDVKMIPSVGYSSKSWSGKWEVASKQSADSWTVEARAPISAFGVDHLADGTNWGALFTTDVLSDPDKFRAWAPGGAFADIPRHGQIEFSGDGAAFQLLNIETIFSGRPVIEAAVVGPARVPATVRVSARFGRGISPSQGDVLLSKDVTAAAGTRQNLQLAPASQPIPNSGFCEITASAGQSVLYHQIFPFTVDGSVRRPPPAIETTPYTQPFGLTASYAPLSKKLVVKVDRFYMPARASVAGGRVDLIDARTGRSVAQSALGEFDRDYSEFAVDLKDVPVPGSNPAAGQPAGALTADYQLRATLNDKSGTQISSTSVPVKLQGYQFSWLPNNIGFSDQVIAPWTPLQWQNGQISLWNKNYTLNGAGIASRILNSGASQLSGPMTLEAVIDGRTVTLTGAAPTAARVTPAAIDLTGVAQAPNLTVNTATRVEFDGFVWNSMTVQPTKANVGKLSLVVTMPESEGSLFVTTSGGWSSYFGDAPNKWDSRESSLPTMKRSYVPYVMLTDSERGFSVFMDNDKGWRLDAALPTQELTRHDGLVTLRVNFIDKAGPIDQPLNIQYGWMVTPQKPQPRAWRGYVIDYKQYYPQSTTVFWNDADRKELWAYYSSPYPRDYQKSAAMLAGTAGRNVVGCVGNIAHAIARYEDYSGRQFDALAADWGNPMGSLSNGDVARSRGVNDFDLFHFDRWVKASGLSCLYFDENYLSEDWNYLTGSAYLLPDGKVQPGYDYLALREYNKRLRYMFQANGKPTPNLWEHTTGGQAAYAWMPDVSMEAENVEPVDLTADYLEILPSSRLRSIGMGRNLGSAPFIMCQAQRHGKGPIAATLVHQFVGWVLAHDVLPEGVPFWPPLAQELELWRDDVKFVGWWVKGSGIEPTVPGVIASAHLRPGNAVLWVVNTNRDDKTATIKIDAKKIGLDPAAAIQAYDAEDGKRYTVTDGVLTVPVPKRMWRAVRLSQNRLVGKNLSFFADFDHEIAANEAWGGRYPLGDTLPLPVDGGKSGKGALIETPLAFSARHHVTGEDGSITLDVRSKSRDSDDQSLIAVGGIELKVNKGALVLRGALVGKVTSESRAVVEDLSWHSVTLAWHGSDVWVACDGATVLTAKLVASLQLPGMGHGLEIRDELHGVEPAQVVFGPMRAIIDNLRMGSVPGQPPRSLFQQTRTGAPIPGVSQSFR